MFYHRLVFGVFDESLVSEVPIPQIEEVIDSKAVFVVIVGVGVSSELDGGPVFIADVEDDFWIPHKVAPLLEVMSNGQAVFGYLFDSQVHGSVCFDRIPFSQFQFFWRFGFEAVEDFFDGLHGDVKSSELGSDLRVR